MGGLSLWHWLVVLLVVVLVFGTKRLRNMGQDVGEAVKGFKKGVADTETNTEAPPAQLPDAARSDEVTRQRDDQQTPR